MLVGIVENARRLRRAAVSSRERMGEMAAVLSETLQGNRVIKTYGMEEFESARFRTANERYFRLSLRTVRLQALNSPIMEVLAGFALAALFAYAAGQIAQGRMTVGALISYLAAILMMYKPLKDVTRTNLAVQLALSSAARIFELVDADNEIREAADARPLPRSPNRSATKASSFRYGDDPVLRDVHLEIRRGETVAIVGPSGAGKTTLVNLLPRLYDPSAGRVTFDGQDLRSATLASLRGQIGLVTQDTILFDSTARENIAYGDPGASPERVRAAASAAYADEFLERLPDGYDARVGESGRKLSGGQKQRLAIARAVYKDAPILILDEATSQLDVESEALVARAVANLMAGRTTLVIAHRLSTVRRADRIVVLEAGRIVEERDARPTLDSRGRVPQAPRHAVLLRGSRAARRGRRGSAMSVRSMTGFGRARAPLSAPLDRGAVGPQRQSPVSGPDLSPPRFRGRARADPEGGVLPPPLAGKSRSVSAPARGPRRPPPEVVVDEGLLGALLARLAELSRRYPVRGELSARDLLAVPHLVSVETAAEGFSPDEIAALEELAGRVASALVAMREQEGRRIGAELIERIGGAREPPGADRGPPRRDRHVRSRRRCGSGCGRSSRDLPSIRDDSSRRPPSRPSVRTSPKRSRG